MPSGRTKEEANEHLFSLVYEELRVVAHRELRRRQRGKTLDTTALVHEAYLKLARGSPAGFRDRGHFLAVASLAMRQILVDAARRRAMKKRHGETTLGTAIDANNIAGPRVEADTLSADILALDQALTALAILDERLGQLVELRFFGGLSVEETAEVLQVSERTVKRDWHKARAWLYRAMQEGVEG